MRCWLEVTFWGTRRRGGEPGDSTVTPVYKAFVWPGTRNVMVERPGRCQPCPPLRRQHCELVSLGPGIFCHLLPGPLLAFAVPRALARCRSFPPSFPPGSPAPVVPRGCTVAACLHLAVQEVSVSLCMLFHISANPRHLGEMVLK